MSKHLEGNTLLNCQRAKEDVLREIRRNFELNKEYKTSVSKMQIMQCLGGEFLALRAYVRKVKVAQSCPTLCDPMDYTIHGILQARILEWVVFPFSRGSSKPKDRTQASYIASRYFTVLVSRV